MENLESPERGEAASGQAQNPGQSESSEVLPVQSPPGSRDEERPGEISPEASTPPVASSQSFLSKKLILGLAGAALLTLTVLAAAVCGAFIFIRQRVEATSWELPLLAEQPSLNQIAFTGNDENVWLVSPDGSGLRQVTKDGRGYRFPTWAPDSRSLAFIGPGTGATALFVSPVGQSDPKIVYSQPGSPPFYLYWAPDSHSLSFLTQEKTGLLALRLVDAQMPEGQRIMDEGAPFYWAWAPNSDRLVMHVGGSRDISSEAHISLLDNKQDAERVELNPAPGRFQAPVWSSDGQYLFYIAGNEAGVDTIYRTQVETGEEKQILNLLGFAHIVLAPDGRHLAYLQFERGTRPPFGKAYLLDVESGEDKPLTQDLIASIYWSPDGRKLALLSINLGPDGPTAKIDGLAEPLSQQGVLRWWVYDVEAESLEPLISFDPTTQFLQTVPYFDQYHLSLTFWSPDSRYLVVTKQESEEGKGSVWVVDTTREEDHRKVGDGALAVWSWR